MVDNSINDVSFTTESWRPPKPVANKKSPSGVKAKSSGFLYPHQTEKDSSVPQGSTTAAFTAVGDSTSGLLLETSLQPTTKPKTAATATKFLFIIRPSSKLKQYRDQNNDTRFHFACGGLAR